MKHILIYHDSRLNRPESALLARQYKYSIVLVVVVCATSVYLNRVSTNNTINTSIVSVVVVCATSVHLDCVSTNNTTRINFSLQNAHKMEL